VLDRPGSFRAIGKLSKATLDQPPLRREDFERRVLKITVDAEERTEIATKEIGGFVGHVQVSSDELTESRLRFGFVASARSQPQSIWKLGQDSQKEVRLDAKVEVDGTLRDLRVGGDLVDAGAFESVAAECRCRGVDETRSLVRVVDRRCLLEPATLPSRRRRSASNIARCGDASI
jgi:hypothetical protein